MRAKDLHCGRGSSPLRTKFSVPKRKSSTKRSPRVEYYIENGVMNINTPSKYDITTFERMEDLDSPKTFIINSLKQTNSSLKNFNRMTKAPKMDSPKKQSPNDESSRKIVPQPHIQTISEYKPRILSKISPK
jgi:hypothetical protein